MRRPFSEPVFVDTSAFVALASPAEGHHGPVQKAFAEAEEQRSRLITTNSVVIETAGLLRRRRAYPGSRRFLDLIHREAARGALSVVYENEEIMEQAEGIFDSWQDPKLSLTDAVSFAVCRHLGIDTALTLDHHFRDAGFLILPAVRRV
jgi:hypothetical protein